MRIQNSRFHGCCVIQVIGILTRLPEHETALARTVVVFMLERVAIDVACILVP